MRRVAVATVSTAVLLVVLGGLGGVGSTAGVTFSGSDESERYVGTDEADTLTGAEGKDFLRGGGGDDTINGDADEDTLVGDEPTDNGRDTISGGDGIDEVAGGPGDDEEYGGADDDLMGSLDYRDKDGPLIEDTGNDLLSGEDGDDFMNSGPGTDELSGGAGVDNLLGGPDPDTLTGGAGDDLLNGEDGVDQARYTGAGSGVAVNLAEERSTGPEGADILMNVEDVEGSSFDDEIRGSSVANKLAGLDSGDTLDGGAGSDNIEGGAGADNIYARDGEVDTIACGDGSDKVQPDRGMDILSGCEIVDVPGPPTATITSGPAEGSVTKQTSVAFGFSSSEGGSTFTCLLTNSEGQAVQPATDTCNSGRQTYGGLPGGTYSFELKATDAFGETSAAVRRTFKVDVTTPAQPTIASPANNAFTRDDTPTFAGKAEADSTVSLRVATAVLGTTKADAAGNWRFTPTTAIPEGVHSITARAADAAGNISVPSTALKITVDKTRPTGSIQINGGAAKTSTRAVTLNLSVSDPSPGSGVFQMCVSNTTDPCTTWAAYRTSRAWTLASGSAGTRAVYVRYKDRAGNVSIYKDTISYAP